MPNAVAKRWLRCKDTLPLMFAHSILLFLANGGIMSIIRMRVCFCFGIVSRVVIPFFLARHAQYPVFRYAVLVTTVFVRLLLFRRM